MIYTHTNRQNITLSNFTVRSQTLTYSLSQLLLAPSMSGETASIQSQNRAAQMAQIDPYFDNPLLVRPIDWAQTRYSILSYSVVPWLIDARK
jgi:hypothetical protein